MIGIITNKECDITYILNQNKVPNRIINPMTFTDLEEFSALIILGGSNIKPLLLEPIQRTLVEDFIATGKKVFAEFVSGLGAISTEEVILSRFERLAYVKDQGINNLDLNDVLDNQCTYRLKPFHEVLKTRDPIMVYTQEHVHSKINPTHETYEEGSYAVFFERDNVLYSSAQWANFNRNRYTPRAKVASFVKWMLEWVCDQDISLVMLEAPYTFNHETRNIKDSVLQVREWFTASDTLLSNGKRGVKEGFSTEINTDGVQIVAENIRADCIGETSFFYYMFGKAYKDSSAIETAGNLNTFLNEHFIIQEGDNEGFVRWSNAAYQSSYGDDAARMLFGLLFKNLFGDGNQQEYKDIVKVCDHIVSTSALDGTRPSRIEIEELTPEYIKTIKELENHSTSAHYSAYTYASLLLAYLLTGNKTYFTTGKKGMDQLIQHYPETVREQSQTQEEARLIFPLSVLYFVTQDDEYKDVLKKVCMDMNLRHHESGCYLEWDEGYKAHMRNTDGDGECSLLSHNGDSVVDLLYTNNWLPLSFSMAYIATQDPYYIDKYKETAKFLMEIQMQSEQKQLNGAWARGYDPTYMEYFGSPADMGWGPYCIETGWTVAEIGAGLIFGEEHESIREALLERRQNL